MAFRKILEYPAKGLLKESIPVSDINVISEVVTDLIDTLNVVGGVGLAAPQIGFRKRIIYVKTSDFESEMINPKIISFDEQHTVPESCLSLPGIFEHVQRYCNVTVEYEKLNNEKVTLKLSGLPAQIVQHEIEHLDGKLMLSHMSRLKRSTAVRKIKKFQKKAASYFADDFEENKITKVKKNTHLSAKEIKIRRNRRKQNR